MLNNNTKGHSGKINVGVTPLEAIQDDPKEKKSCYIRLTRATLPRKGMMRKRAWEETPSVAALVLPPHRAISR